MSESLTAFIADLVRSTRPSGDESNISRHLLFGAGPRAGIALISVAKAHAYLNGVNEVKWAHVRRFIKPVFRHRIKVNLSARRSQLDEEKVIDLLTQEVENKAHAFFKL